MLYLGCQGTPKVAWQAKSSSPEELLATLDEEGRGRNFEFSRDGRVIAQRIVSGGRTLIACRGKRSDLFDAVGPIAFSPDGSTIAYPARQGGEWFLVVNQSAGREKFTSIGSPVFSPDGKHLAVQVRTADKASVMLDGVAGEGYLSVRDPLFCADSKHLAYAARGSRGWTLVLDGKEQGSYENLLEFAFNRSGSSLALRCRKGSKEVVQLDGKTLGEFDEIGSLLFLANDHDIVFSAELEGKWRLVSTDRVRDDKEYGSIGGLTVGAKSQVAYFVVQAGRQKVVVDGVPEPVEFEYVDPPVLSSDGSRMAYTAETERKRFLVRDGKPIGPFNTADSVTLSQDGGRVACRVIRDGKYAILVDKQVIGAYDWAGPPTFSADGNKISCGAVEGNKHWWKVIDLKKE